MALRLEPAIGSEFFGCAATSFPQDVVTFDKHCTRQAIKCDVEDYRNGPPNPSPETYCQLWRGVMLGNQCIEALAYLGGPVWRAISGFALVAL